MSVGVVGAVSMTCHSWKIVSVHHEAFRPAFGQMSCHANALRFHDYDQQAQEQSYSTALPFNSGSSGLDTPCVVWLLKLG